MDKQQIKEFLGNYQDQDGNNPFSAGLELLTFAKWIPLHIIKGVGLALLIYIGLTLALWWLSVPWWMMMVFMIGGTIGLVFLALTGTFRFIALDLANNVSGLILGILQPIDETYDYYKANGKIQGSKKAFAEKVISEVVIPQVFAKLKILPFRDRLEKMSKNMAAKISDEENEADLPLATTPATAGAPTFLDQMISKVELAGTATKRGIGKPFNLALQIMIGCWLVLVLYFLWTQYGG